MAWESDWLANTSAPLLRLALGSIQMRSVSVGSIPGISAPKLSRFSTNIPASPGSFPPLPPLASVMLKSRPNGPWRPLAARCAFSRASRARVRALCCEVCQPAGLVLRLHRSPGHLLRLLLGVLRSFHQLAAFGVRNLAPLGPDPAGGHELSDGLPLRLQGPRQEIGAIALSGTFEGPAHALQGRRRGALAGTFEDLLSLGEQGIQELFARGRRRPQLLARLGRVLLDQSPDLLSPPARQPVDHPHLQDRFLE